jgi:hypothetical protein
LEIVWRYDGSHDINTSISSIIGEPVNPSQFRGSLLLQGKGLSTSAYVLPPSKEPSSGAIPPNSGDVAFAPGLTLKTGRGTEFWHIEAGVEAVGKTFLFWAHSGGASEVIVATINEPGLYPIGNHRGMNAFYFYGQLEGCAMARSITRARYRLTIDPSGYVYEAVLSNRLEGVTATIFRQGETGAWGAIAYEQQNPLITGIDGYYAWDVPPGNWRVRYEKPGFVTAHSIWMPVPPEHTEVHIGLISNAVPYVTRMTGYPSGIEILFDKYMAADSLISENITVMQDGVAIQGKVVLVNRESNYLLHDYLHGSIQPNGFPSERAQARDFASIVRFVPISELSGTVQVTISGDAASYAGATMGDDHNATLTIIPEPMAINAESIRIGFDEVGSISVSAYPAAAVAGRSITAVSDNPAIVEVQNNHVSFDSNGNAILNARGLLPGAASITISLDDSLLVAQAAIMVAMPVDIREYLGYEDEILGIYTESPTITSDNSHAAGFGTFNVFQVTATGAPSPFFGISGAPAGVTINPATGLMNIAGSTESGTHSFTVTASNGVGVNSTQSFNLTISRIEDDPNGNDAANDGGANDSPTGDVPNNSAPNGNMPSNNLPGPAQAGDGEQPTAPVQFINPFYDVSQSDWFYENVAYVYLNGFMTGTGQGHFAPNTAATRAMVVQVLYNIQNRPSVAGRDVPFNDVAVGRWHTDAVVWAYHQGLVSGFGDGSFRPSETITRAHLIVILNNYANLIGAELPAVREPQAFTDAAGIRNYAAEAIARFSQAMIISGRPDGRFDPQGSATRAELAAILHRFMESKVYGDDS